MPFQLDRVELTLRKVSMQDYSGGLIPRNVSVDLHVDKEVKTDITNPAILVSWIVLKVVTGSALGNLGIDPAALQGSVTEAFAASEKLLGDASAQSEKLASEANETLAKAASGLKDQKIVGGTQQALSGAAGSAKSQVSGLFGKLKEKVQ